MSSKKPAVYSYTRFSTPEQRKGTGQHRQDDAVVRWCKSKGYELFQNYADLGVSAFKGKNATHGELGKFIELVRAGKIAPNSILLVESLDRLSRNTISRAAELFLSLTNAGLTVVTLCDKMEFKGDVDFGQLIMSLSYFARANDESRMKSQRKAGSWAVKRKNAATGRPHGGKTPGWIRTAGDKYEVIADEADKVRQLFADYVAGSGIYTLSKKTGIPKATIAFWLNNPVVIGTLKVTEDGHTLDIPNHYPAIIDNTTWKLARAKKAERFIVRRAGKTGSVNLFTGKLFDHKGHRLDVANHYGFNSYISPNGICIQARNLEVVVCAEKLGQKFVTTKYVEQQHSDPRLIAIDAKIAAVQKEMTDADIVTELIPVLREFKRQRKEIEADKQNTVVESLDYSLIQSLLTDAEDIDARRKLREIVRDTIDTVVSPTRPQSTSVGVETDEASKLLYRESENAESLPSNISA